MLRSFVVRLLYCRYKGRYRLSNVFCGTAAAAATNMMFESLQKMLVAQTAAAAGPNYKNNLQLAHFLISPMTFLLQLANQQLTETRRVKED